MANVALRGVCKAYNRDDQVVGNFNLTVNHGEFLVLVGPSGCGKSTTLRMIAGLEEISAGEIRIGDRVVNDVPPKDRDISMVFQNYALYPHMSVYDNMAFGLKLRNIPKPEIRKRVEDAAAVLGLTGLLHRKPRALSGGQRQRVAMGRAIVRNPAVFLFDEPLSNLDAKMRVEMRREILQLHQRIQTTMIYVTHDQVEAMTLGDRICVMNGGVIEQVGRPVEIFEHPATLFVARFIGMPSMNIFEGTLRRENNLPIFDGGSVCCPLSEENRGILDRYEGRKVCLGIRSKALHLIWADESCSGVFEGEVVVSEMLGDEVLIHVESGRHRYVASVTPHQAAELTGSVRFGADVKQVHLFDAETGRNIQSEAF